MASEDRISSLASEIRRRKIPRSLIAYILIFWALIQIGEVMLPVLGIPHEQPLRILLIVAIAGTPGLIAFSWFYQITKDGIVRTQSEERRVLNNIAPVNDRRKQKVGQYFSAQEAVEDYQWLILFETGPLEGLTYGINDAVVIGRALDCDITVLTNHVSRRHAKLTSVGDDLMVEDMGSANGTRVNGTLISEPTALAHDDEVQLQEVAFKVSQSYSRSSTESSAMNKTTVIGPSSD